MRHYKELSRLWKPFSQKNISMYAAGACFYFFLSAVPAAVLFLSSITFFPALSDIWGKFFKDALPTAFLPILTSFLEYTANNYSFTTISISVFTLMWSASKGILSILDGLNFALDYPKAGNYFFKRFLSLVYFMLFSVSILLVMFTLVFADYIFSSIEKNFKGISIILQSLIRFRGVAAYMILSTLFSLLIRWLPTRRLPVKACLLGGLLSSFSWILLSTLFSVYIDNFPNNNNIAGSMGLLVLSALWLKLCISAILYSTMFAKLHAEGLYHPFTIIKDTLKKI